VQTHVSLGKDAPYDEIVDALRSLDSGPLPKWKRVLRRERPGSNENPDGGFPLTRGRIRAAVERDVSMTSAKGGRTERLQIMMDGDELAMIDDFRFRSRMPSFGLAALEWCRMGSSNLRP